MPGISFVYDSEQKIKQNGNFILRSINSLIHDDNYESEVLLTNNSYFLAGTRYPEYPRRGDLAVTSGIRIYGNANIVIR